jgi:hypothetical protein
MNAASWRKWLLLGVGASLTALFLYRGALDGTFVSDDVNHVPNNPHIRSLDWPHLVALLDPAGLPARATSNYAPVHLLIHALQWLSTRGCHVTTCCTRAFAAWAFTRLIQAGAAFLPRSSLHPANVRRSPDLPGEADLAPGFARGAARLPACCSSGAFGWRCSRRSRRSTRFRWAAALPGASGATGILAWLAIAVACSAAELPLFQRTGEAPSSYVILDPGERIRSMVAIAGRYLVMSATSWGISPTHEPAPATSLADPWWLFGLAALAAVGARALVTLHRRREESVFWVWAAASYVPISQVFTFIYPMADRYLYFILPGLLGGAFWMAHDAWSSGRAAGSRRASSSRPSRRRGRLAAGPRSARQAPEEERAAVRRYRRDRGFGRARCASRDTAAIAALDGWRIALRRVHRRRRVPSR